MYIKHFKYFSKILFFFIFLNIFIYIGLNLTKSISISKEYFLNRTYKKTNIIKLLKACEWSDNNTNNCMNYLNKTMYSKSYKKDYFKININNKKMLIHVYWKGEPTEKLSLMIKSFLYTQYLPLSQLHVWIDNKNFDIKNNKYTLIFMPYVEKEYIIFNNFDIDEKNVNYN